MAKQEATTPKYIKFLFGGGAGMAATCFVQPLDLVKNRMQLSGEGGKAKEHKTSLHAIRSILRQEGVRGIYTGLSAGLLRQATYTTTRLGVYTMLFEQFSKGDKPPGFFMKASIGMVAGGVGAFIGTPAEISLIRMTADGRLPPAERRNYKGVFNALTRITREEGVTTLWRGCGPTVGRAIVVNAAQLSSYSQAKQIVLNTGDILVIFSLIVFAMSCTLIMSGWVDGMESHQSAVPWLQGCGPTVGRAVVVNAAQLASYSQAKQLVLGTGYFSDNVLCHFVASMISGLITTAASMPVDIVKTRIQNMKTIDGVPEYKGALDVLFKTIRKEGFFSLWKGFTPYYARLGPHTVLTFIFLEQMNKWYAKVVLGKDNIKGGL